MMRRNKKGSMELGIQAIVILVMAMAVLGLGLGFIRGLIKKGEVNFGSAIDNAELENPATAERPVTIDGTVQVKAGKTAKVRIGFYNTDHTPPDDGFIPTLNYNCTNKYTLISGAQEVPQGEARGYKAILKANQDLTTDTQDVCTIQFKNNDDNIIASKQFYVEIIG